MLAFVHTAFFVQLAFSFKSFFLSSVHCNEYLTRGLSNFDKLKKTEKTNTQGEHDCQPFCTWHVFPSVSEGQTHTKLRPWSAQDPPFLQGYEEHDEAFNIEMEAP